MKHFNRTIGLVIGMGLIAAVSMLAGCGTNGKLVSSTNPISAPATVAAACGLVIAADGAFQTFATLYPKVIDANGMATEAAVMGTVGLTPGGGAATATSPCAPNATINVAAAETTLISAAFQISNLLKTWQK